MERDEHMTYLSNNASGHSSPNSTPRNPYPKQGPLILLFVYGMFWLLVVGLGANDSNPVATFLSKVGFSLFWGIIAYVLIVDWSGSISLGGTIHWRRMPSDKRFVPGCLYVLFFPLLLGLYLLIVIFSYHSFAPLATSVATRRQRIGTIVATLVLLSTLVLYTSSNISLATPSTPVAHQTQRASMRVTPTPLPTLAPTPTPTLKPSPTSTPLPTINANAAILGGSVVAFDRKFGADNCCYENGWDLANFWIGVYTDESASQRFIDEHSTAPVRGIRIIPRNPTWQPDEAVWSHQKAIQICSAYLPPDAVFQKTYPKMLADTVMGEIHVYSSKLLANTLPHADFTDEQGQPEQPGLFFVYYDHHYQDDADHIGYCALGTDATLKMEDV
jgi:hypothetical protein